MPNPPPRDAKSPEVAAFWNAFRRASGLEGDDYDVVAFGDSPKMSDDLAALVMAGTKRSTAGLRRDFSEGGEAMPRVGGHVVLIDGGGRPRCVWRTTEATVRPLIEVDERFAWDEGEGNRTLASWLAAHRAYFKRQAEREGFRFHDRLETVFERFAVVWPPEAAD